MSSIERHSFPSRPDKQSAARKPPSSQLRRPGPAKENKRMHIPGHIGSRPAGRPLRGHWSLHSEAAGASPQGRDRALGPASLRLRPASPQRPGRRRPLSCPAHGSAGRLLSGHRPLSGHSPACPAPRGVSSEPAPQRERGTRRRGRCCHRCLRAREDGVPWSPCANTPLALPPGIPPAVPELYSGPWCISTLAHCPSLKPAGYKLRG